MDPNSLTSSTLADAAAPPSLWAIVMHADIVVQAVMVLLLLASLWCWAVIFQKSWRIARLRAKASGLERTFWEGAPLDDLFRRLGKRPDHPMATMFVTAMEEWRESPPVLLRQGSDSVLDRVGRAMEVAMDRELASLETHLGSLATIGSAAPFVGLFGTVWGIMNSFQSIAVTKNTTLAVVAPGIAEALLATAIGLAAAIPAVVAYNKLSSEVDRYAARLQSFGDELRVVFARELDQKRAG